MASDDISSGGQVALENHLEARHALPKPRPVIVHTQDVSGVEAVRDAGDGQPAAVQLLGGEEPLPWIALAKWRKGLVLAGLFLGLFLSTLDTSIIATALVTIVTELDDFQRSPWVVVAYLLLYMSLAVAFARLSDVYGRKSMVLTAWIIFTAFSIGCGTAQTMIQLIVFRALQGVGGSGLFSMTMVMIPEVVSPEKMGLISAMIGMTLGCSGLLGPILGGVISHFTTWRWIFYINIPLGCLAITSILVAWPRTPGLPLSSWAAFQSIDFIGIFLILAASIMHIWGFESVSVMNYNWNSPTIIAVLVLAASCWVTFVIWQLFLESRKDSIRKPVFPIRIVQHRVMAAAILSSFLTGFPFIVTVIMLPERFQIVNGASSLMTGVYLLPLLGASAIGSYLGGAFSSKRNLTSYTLIVSSLLQMAGCGLLSTLGAAVDIIPRQYAFEAILGLGIGLSLSTVTIMTSVQAKRGDLAAAQGAVSQVRVLGGIVGLTIATTLFNRRSYSTVSIFLTPAEVSALHISPLAILSFSPTKQLLVKLIYANLFSLQMRILMYICAVAVAVSLASWEKDPPDVKKGMEVHRRSGPPVGAVIEIPDRK